jgi:4-oxalocrotonate tautomerase family enzyme
MPLIDIHVIKGSCTPEQKRAMMEETTEMIGRVLAEPVKDLTWVRVIEVGEDEWMIAGEVFTLEHVRKLRAGELRPS